MRKVHNLVLDNHSVISLPLSQMSSVCQNKSNSSSAIRISSNTYGLMLVESFYLVEFLHPFDLGC